jgi:hypothetical protein
LKILNIYVFKSQCKLCSREGVSDVLIQVMKVLGKIYIYHIP